MNQPGNNHQAAHWQDVFLPASRLRALSRATLWTAAAALLIVACIPIYGSLSFQVTGATNRIIEYSIAIIALPLPCLALITGFTGLRWLILGLWPKSTGFLFARDRLEISLGVFGRHRLPLAHLDIKYPYDLDEDEADGSFESFLPQDIQRATLVPAMTHPAFGGKIHLELQRFTAETEQQLATRLQDVFDHWHPPKPDEDDEDDEV
ncbi:MAG: hypothetical protein ACYTHJ_10140 [Planctomycetota bacterium]|jgi:hypothetical protein